MKNGYYLSTYLYINDLFYCYDITLRHDQNIALWRKKGNNIELIHFWELERISGLKAHNRPFLNVDHAKCFINNLLRQYGLNIDDMVEIWGTPGLDTCNDYHTLEQYPDYTYHSMAHLFSSLLLNTEIFYTEDFIALAVDGGSDEVVDIHAQKKMLFSGCVSRKGKIEMFHIPSPGPLWFLANYYFNYKEGTLMALANATTSKIHKIPDILDSTMSFPDIANLSQWFAEYMDELEFDSDESTYIKNCLNYDSDFSQKDNLISMVMKEIQNKSIHIMEQTIQKIIKDYQLNPKETNLALSGGYALNCPTNSYIMNRFEFKNLYAPPCINDGGISLGVGLYAFYKKNNQAIHFKFRNAYYGDRDDSLEEIASDNEFIQFIESIQDFNKDVFYDDICTDPVVWINDRAEIGPRALGNRSILGDPRSTEIKDKLNTIKKRQWWRPVAPIIIEDYLNEWFEDAFPSPYMLNTFVIKPDKIDKIPAVSHIDESSRIQTISLDSNPLLYQAIYNFFEKSGVPILCNTSLNDAGEPIINTVREALNFSLRKHIKIMYVNGKRVELRQFSEYLSKEPYQRKAQDMKILSDQELMDMRKKLNPHNLSPEDMSIYQRLPELRNEYNIQNKDECLKLKEIIERLCKAGIIDRTAFNNI